MIPKVLLLIKQIRPRAAQVDDLWTPVPVLLQPRALEAIERVGDALHTQANRQHSCLHFCISADERGGTDLAATNNTFVLIISERALVADAHQRCRAHVAVTHGAFAVAFVAQPADCYAGLFAAHY